MTGKSAFAMLSMISSCVIAAKSEKVTWTKRIYKYAFSLFTCSR